MDFPCKSIPKNLGTVQHILLKLNTFMKRKEIISKMTFSKLRNKDERNKVNQKLRTTRFITRILHRILKLCQFRVKRLRSGVFGKQQMSEAYFFSPLILKYTNNRVKVFKNGPSKICEKQPLKKEVYINTK